MVICCLFHEYRVPSKVYTHVIFIPGSANALEGGDVSGDKDNVEAKETPGENCP